MSTKQNLFYKSSAAGTASGAATAIPVSGTTSETKSKLSDFAIYFMMGAIFGIILIKGEVISWFRIQEMFRFQAFHMYGVIGSAIAVGAVSLQLIKRLGVKTIHGDVIKIADKPWGKGIGYSAGGLIFGFGWALLGACPGPIYALIGAGVSVIVVALAAALLGTWTYALVKRYLPH